MKISKELLIKLEELYSQYEKKVLKAEEDKCLEANTSKTYLLHSNNFSDFIQYNKKDKRSTKSFVLF